MSLKSYKFDDEHFGIPQDGSGPIKGQVAPCLASFNFPQYPHMMGWQPF